MIFFAPRMLLWAFPSVIAVNFPYESHQLKTSEVKNNSDFQFGNSAIISKPVCKTFPGDVSWPSSERWDALNTSLGGALIKGVPPAAACYAGEYNDATKCAAVRRGERNALWA